MKKIFRSLVISTLVTVPLAMSGINFIDETSNYNNVEEVDLNTRSADDEYYIDGMSYAAHSPSAPIFDADNNISFSFLVEYASTNMFPTSFSEFNVVFEEIGSYYEDYSPLEVITFDSESFSEEFKTSGGGNPVTYNTINPITLSYPFNEGEQYQYRISWIDNEAAGEVQYTKPTEFLFGYNAPSISFSAYEGYEQAAIKMTADLSGDPSDWYGGIYLSEIYKDLKFSWGTEQNINVISELEDTGSTYRKDLIWDQSTTGDIVFYFLFDDLVEEDEISIHVDYTLNPDNYGLAIKGTSDYAIPFTSNTYQAPIIQEVDESKIDVYDIDTPYPEEIPMFGDVVVPVTLEWTDTMFPKAWLTVHDDFGGTQFNSEVEFRELVKDITVDSISNSKGDVDPSTVQISDESSSKAWDEVAGQMIKTTDVYFDDLELGETYTVTLAYHFNDPMMFTTEPETVTSKFTFTVPDAVEKPEFKITDISVPLVDGEISDDPTNWNELEVKFDLVEPGWDATFKPNMNIKDMFTSIKVKVYDKKVDIHGDITYEPTGNETTFEPSLLNYTDNTVLVENLNSNDVYGFEIEGKLNDKYSRIFGYDINDDNYLTSEIISSNTRERSDLPEISINNDTHDEYEYDDQPNYKYTFGFWIDSPASGEWSFITDADAAPNTESAYYYKNIIKDVYITNVYTEEDTSSSDAQNLYNDIFFVDNTIGSSADSKATDIGSLYIDNVTNDMTNTNLIEVTGLSPTTLYNANLVIELTDTASNENTGWIDSKDDKIITPITMNTGNPAKAPVVTIVGGTQQQDKYNKHSVTFDMEIDISKIKVGSDFTSPDERPIERAYFEDNILENPYGLPGDLTTTVRTLVDGEETGTPVTYDWAAYLPTIEDNGGTYDATAKKYKFQLTVPNLDGNTSYEIVLENSENLKVVEDVLNVTQLVTIDANDVLTGTDFNGNILGAEIGSQDEATNTYNNVQIELGQRDFDGGVSADPAGLDQDYYDKLSGNIENIEIVEAGIGGKVVATFDPETINTLTPSMDGGVTPGTTIIANVLEPVTPKSSINLANYNLKVTNDENSGTTDLIALNTVMGMDTLEVGAINTPVVNELNFTSYKGGIVADWNVSDMNNIEHATLNIYHKGILDPDPTKDEIVDTVEYDATNFATPTADAWVDSHTFTEFVANKEYYAELIIKPSALADSTTEIVTYSDIAVGAEAFNIQFDILSTSTSRNSVRIEFEWDSNTGNRVNDFKLDVVDTFNISGGPLEEAPIIFTKEWNDIADSGTEEVTVNNDDLIEGYQIFSNQDYELDLQFKKKGIGDTSPWNSVTQIVTDINDSELLNVTTIEKDVAFFDNIAADESKMTENSFEIDYTWNGREQTSDVNKNITDHSITIYEGEIIDEEKVIWNSGNLVDSNPEEDGTLNIKLDDPKDTGATINGEIVEGLEIFPNAKFTISSDVTYDTFAYQSREKEQETITTKVVSIPYDTTEITLDTERSHFIDNDTIALGFDLTNIASFAFNDNNYITIYIQNSAGEMIDFIFNGNPVAGNDGLVITYGDIKDSGDEGWVIDEGSATLDIEVDGAITKPEDKVTVYSSVDITNGDFTSNSESDAVIKNDSPQTESPWIEANNFGVIQREYSSFAGKYNYEVQVQSNFPITGGFKEVYISEIGAPLAKSSDVEVLNKSDVATTGFEFNENNLYLRVDGSLVSSEMQYNDLSFLVGRYIVIDGSNLHAASKGIKEESDYSFFLINDFFWLYPPKTGWEIFLNVLKWILIVLAIILLILSLIGLGYYIFRITFSNKKWYPIVGAIAAEKFEVFTNYIDELGWTEKYQDYEDLSEKNIKELRDYALKMNIPITFDMTRQELLDTVSLLNEEEIARYHEFTDDDIEVKHYEILEYWKVERYKKHNFWIKYRMSKMLEKGILSDDDDRLDTVQAQIEYIEKEKQLHAEREEAFAEIKEMVAEVLDTNVELTSEFSADPLSDFKSELEAKAEAERKAEEEAEQARIEAEEMAAAAAALAEEKRIKAEEAKAKADQEAEEARVAKEIANIKQKLKYDFKPIAKEVEDFNEKSSPTALSPADAKKLKEKLSRERLRVKKLMDVFKTRQDRITELGGIQKEYEFPTLSKVRVKLQLSKLEQLQMELDEMTKQQMIDKAKKLKVEVKASWSKDKLAKDIIKQLKDRGEE